MGVALPSDLISDPRTTPFNIGERIVLRDFTRQEAASLESGLGSNAAKMLDRVFYWTSGHPFLTQTLCSAIAVSDEVSNARGVDRLVHATFLDPKARETNVNLSDVSNRILNGFDDPNGVEGYRTVILGRYQNIWQGKRVEDDESQRPLSILKLSGILKVEKGLLVVRNRVYGTVFGKDWISDNMPNAELRRQKIAFWEGVFKTAFISAVIFTAIGSFAFWALMEKQRAEEATQQLQEEIKTQALTLEQAKYESQRANEALARATSEQKRAEQAELRAEQLAEALSVAADEASYAKKK